MSTQDTVPQPIIKMCIDRVLSPQDEEKAQLMAAEANPQNKVERTQLDPVTGKAIGIAFEYRKCWAPGTQLHVRFLGGLPIVKKKIAQVAKEWERYANIKFVFDDSPDAQIRIAFFT